jgi:hypothetical protein
MDYYLLELKRDGTLQCLSTTFGPQRFSASSMRLGHHEYSSYMRHFGTKFEPCLKHQTIPSEVVLSGP